MTGSRGQHLIGKALGSCVLERLLGYGGSSAVFLAQECHPEREVAIKVFLPRINMDARMQKDFYRRFLREAEAASKLNHPNILPIYSYGEQDGLPYIVMPYMPGGTLSEYMATRGPLALHEAQWYLEQMAAALDYAHDHGCVHCDVKPANMLLDSEGRVMLSDFGIARVIQTDEESGVSVVKAPETVMGTPDYISPEQALGRELDGRSDVYSLGITLFYLLTKQLPFNADSTIALALLHVHEPPPSLTSRRADSTPALDRVMRKVLAKDPAQRFQSASEFSVAFTEAVAASKPASFSADGYRTIPLSDHADGPISDAQPIIVNANPAVRVRPVRRRSGAAILLVILLCLTIIGTAGWALRFAFNGFGHAVARMTPTPTARIAAASIDQLTNIDNWPVSNTFYFDSHTRNYHVINKSAKDVALAPYYDHVFGNFRLTVTTSEVHGSNNTSNYYGVMFRASSDESHYYVFAISPVDGGHYTFLRYDGQWNSIKDGPIASLVTGSGKSNTITIEAHGNSLTFSVNGKAVDAPISDPANPPLTSGQIGFYVEDEGVDIAFSQLYIEKL